MSGAVRHDAVMHDSVVLGGALTGTVLYIALSEVFAKHNKSLIILERESRPIPDSRMLSLGYAGGTLLRRFGVWDELQKYLCPVRSLSLSPINAAGRGTDGKDVRGLVVEAGDLGLPALGWTVPHQKLQDVLWDKVRQLQKQHSNLTEEVPFTMESIALEGDVAVIKGGDKTITSGLVFAATGTAPLPWAGTHGSSRINYTYYGDNQDKSSEEKPAFIVAEVKLKPTSVSHSHNRGYWFGGNSGGRAKDQPTAIALTPSAQGDDIYVAIASMPTKPQQIKSQEFSMTLQNIIGQEFSVESITEDPVVYQASSYLATDRVLGPLVLIGNAAHSVAPLGGQNYNLTLWTLGKLRDIIAGQLDSGLDFSERSFLMDYITQTDPEIKRSLAMVHKIDDWLTGSDAFGESHLNNLLASVLPPDAMFQHFMQTMHQLPDLRNKIFARAAGLHRV